MEKQTFFLNIPIDTSEGSEDFEDCNGEDAIQAQTKELEHRKLRVTVTETGVQFALMFKDGEGIVSEETPAREIMNSLYDRAIFGDKSIIKGGMWGMYNSPLT